MLVSDGYEEDLKRLKQDVKLRDWPAFDKIDWELRNE